MSYNQKHLQATAHHITQQLRYQDTEPGSNTLTHTHTKFFENALLVILGEIAVKHPKVILIPHETKKLQPYFIALKDARIVFPTDTRYRLTREGITFEIKEGTEQKVVNIKKERARVKRGRLNDIKEALNTAYYRFDANCGSDAESDRSDGSSGAHDAVPCRGYTPRLDALRASRNRSPDAVETLEEELGCGSRTSSTCSQ